MKDAISPNLKLVAEMCAKASPSSSEKKMPMHINKNKKKLHLK